jgi:hypothetical protein
MGRPESPFTFNPDLADPVEPPPLVFHRMNVPCSCGGTFVGQEHLFFNSTVFIRGLCASCGPRSAMFAPPVPVEDQPELTPQQEAAVSEISEMLKQVRQRFRFNSPEVLAGVVDYLKSKNIA